MKGAELVSRLAAALALALLAANLFLMLQALQRHRRELDTLDSLRKLATLSFHNFPERGLLTEERFWDSIGRKGSPMRDHWGSPFILAQKPGEDNKARFYWRSAGPDGVAGNGDDLEMPVPLADGAPIDIPDPNPHSYGAPVIDAK